ncbi:MAG TPA: GC-type dockerin domain-anchored protein [Phycisphaerales bacterium]|nr:GC-type dockerin domain-anchored protein [Phycisphaerales bacterium]
MKPHLLALLACAATAVAADDIVWLNVSDYPGDLAATGDAWSAIRAESPDQWYSIAADDFTLEISTVITSITFFGAEVGEPEILGGDWYIFTGPAEGPPQTLVAHGAGVPMAHVDTGLVNDSFGAVWANVMEPEGLELPAGHYFLAFRTFQTLDLSGPKNNNGAFTTRTALGTSRAWWNSDVLADGTVSGTWVEMEVFNLVEDQEWSFLIEGEPSCRVDLNGDGFVDTRDVLQFLNEWANQDEDADWNSDGAIDTRDVIAFLNDWRVSCS